jgi:hypothetical protein
MVKIDRNELARALAAEAARIVETLRRADMRTVEEDEDGAVRTRHVIALHASMSEAAQLLASSEEQFDDGDAADVETPAQGIVDIAAMAAIVLAEKRRLLPFPGDDIDRWELIERCDRAQRAAVRSLTALENALADFAGAERRLLLDDELAKGLRVRQQYEVFRLAVHDFVGDESKTLLQRVRSAGTAMAMLIGRDEYPLMRAGDRILLRKLHQRVLDWVASGERNECEALHLCSELLSITELLMTISCRAELIEHDRTTLRAAAIVAAAHKTDTEGD